MDPHLDSIDLLIYVRKKIDLVCNQTSIPFCANTEELNYLPLTTIPKITHTLLHHITGSRTWDFLGRGKIGQLQQGLRYSSSLRWMIIYLTLKSSAGSKELVLAKHLRYVQSSPAMDC